MTYMGSNNMTYMGTEKVHNLKFANEEKVWDDFDSKINFSSYVINQLIHLLDMFIHNPLSTSVALI